MPDGGYIQTILLKNGQKLKQYVYKIEDMESFLTDLEKFESKLAELYINHHIKIMKSMRSQVDKKAVRVDNLEDELKLLSGLYKGNLKDHLNGKGKKGKIARFLIDIEKSRTDAPFTKTKRLGMEFKAN